MGAVDLPRSTPALTLRPRAGARVRFERECARRVRALRPARVRRRVPGQHPDLNTSVWTDSFDRPIAPQDLVNCYLPADVTVDNGVTFTPHVNASCGYDSGLISTFNSRFFTYGYFEARIY